MVTKPIHILYLKESNESAKRGTTEHFTNAADLVLVGCVDSFETALDLCEELDPHILLIEIGFPATKHVDAIRVIRFHYPQIKILVLTATEEIDSVRVMMSVGVSGYLVKRIDLPDLAASIRAINSGAIIFSRAITRSLIQTDLTS